jgi:hypothetical protein
MSFECLTICCRLKFSNIEFTENPVIIPAASGNIKKESIGCIQLVIKKMRDVKFTAGMKDDSDSDDSSNSSVSEDEAPKKSGKTSALKVWERDEKLAGKVSISTRFAISGIR